MEEKIANHACMNERFSSFSYGEKQKYPPTRLVQELDIQYNEQTVCLSGVQHLKGTK